MSYFEALIANICLTVDMYNTNEARSTYSNKISSILKVSEDWPIKAYYLSILSCKVTIVSVVFN